MVVGTANIVTSYSWQHPLLFMESRTSQEKWEEKRKRNIHMDTTDTHTHRGISCVFGRKHKQTIDVVFDLQK